MKSFSILLSNALLLSFLTVVLHGQTYYVSPNGQASWADARSDSPLSGTECTSLSTANTNATAGDLIIMRGGIFNTNINPRNSGTGINAQIVYQAFEGETPIISQDGDPHTNFIAIYLDGCQYVKVHGVKVENVGRWALFTRGASYNEISHCMFSPPVIIGLNIYRGDSGLGDPCAHNWIHNSTFHGCGRVSDVWNDENHIMQIGEQTYDGASGNNTIESCVLYHGGHHLLETYTQFNVIKNNYMHNESWMDPPEHASIPPLQEPASNGKYGNRCFTLDAQKDGASALDGAYNLVEGNRFGHAGRPPDDDGADNAELASHRNIFRFNYIFNAAKDGLYIRDGAHGSVFGSHNRVYNNTVFGNGINESDGYNSLYRRSGIFFRPECTGNKIINNISIGNYNKDINTGWPRELHGNTISNNWLSDSERNDSMFITPSLVGDPLFYNLDVSDPFNITLPDLRVLSTSPVIDLGIHITHTVEAGNNSTTLMVKDALFFQDGTRGSALTHGVTHFPDWIAIGKVDSIVEIRAIDYGRNIITLASPITWNEEDPIWLYRNSAGRIVLYGQAPDIGAYEYSGVTGIDDNADNGNDNQNGSDDDNDGENSNDDGEQTTTQVHAQTGHQLALYQNYPNPFSHSTTITFKAPTTSHYILEVYDITGKIVATLLNETKEAGRHSVTMNSSQYNLSNGVYFYRLIAGEDSYIINRMIRLK